MVAGLSAVLVTLAQAAAAASPAAAPQAKAPAAAPSASGVPACREPRADSQTIVICVERSQGYRLDPDVMEAKRETKDAGRPVRPGGRVTPDCTNVGPAPCTTAGVNLVGAALTAVEMAKRAATGEEVGSMFLTDPHPTEYQLYLMAKQRREAEEEQRIALEKVKAAKDPPKQDSTRAASQPLDPSHD
ncbi:MAG TPA: hypothetical protein VH392_03170 [Sphingomicrobium sp.]